MKRVWSRVLWVLPVLAGGLAPAQAEDVECDGVGWPVGYMPVAVPFESPSHRLGLEARVEFPMHRLPPVDTQKLLAEDEANTGWGKPPRVGINRPLDKFVVGKWHDAPQGGRLWTAAIQAEGAFELRLHFVDVNLPPGAEIYVYSPQDADHGVGPYTEAGSRRTGEFWAGTITGDTVHIEYYVPDGDLVTLPFDIDEVGHMYRPLNVEDDNGERGARSWSDCMWDVPCEPDWPLWEDVSHSVARTRWTDGQYWYYCTGQLLAAQNGDLTPYFLTSAHCVDLQSQADDMQFRWFYQHSFCSSCNDLAGGGKSCVGSLMTSKYSYDADLLATSGGEVGADWTLLMVKGVLPPGLYWSGWMTTDPSNYTWSVGLHHPDGSWKRWSRGRRDPLTSSYFHKLNFNLTDAVGHIYYGSSGSGIWRESDQKLFGNCSGGDGEPGCDYLNTRVYYGKFSNYYSSISSYLAGGSDDAFEDNDSCAGAVTLNDGTYNDLVVKSLDEDWYSISLAHNGQVDVDLFFVDFYGNINVQLYDACGGSVVAFSTTTSNNEFLTYINSGAAADFYLRVYLSDDTRNTYNMDCDIINPEDLDPPTPNPMTFATPPYALGQTSIRMVATTATDADSPPVEYYFTFVSGDSGGNDSGWQSSPEYTDEDLELSTQYCYQVKARDSALPPNETGYSEEACATTLSAPIPTVTEWGLVVMILLVCTAGTVIFLRRKTQPVAARR